MFTIIKDESGTLESIRNTIQVELSKHHILIAKTERT